ncbi:MAG TPA: sugar ABC transporter ATP-binding protein [Solirubrobacteraceae bacterium]|nr:sugar ABC transporter ATP-binding protein [Solirubrobacteraceae bacterium]
MIDASIDAYRGEVLALLGHNGSGKSTLIKVLAGFHQPDPGAAAWVDEEPIRLGDPDAAKNHGLRFVHQDLGLIRELNAVDNVALTIGYVRTRSGRVDQSRQKARTSELLGRFGVELDVTQPLGDASPVERTSVAIARAMWDWDLGPRILVLDEPTASLPSREVSRLFDVIREVRTAGHAVIYVSHRMEEIFDIADRVLVLRTGRVVGRGMVNDRTPAELASLIAGHAMSDDAPQERASGNGELALQIRSLRGRFLDGVDLDLHRGEILGVAGLLGSGRDELPYAVAGAVRSESDGPWQLGDRKIEPPTTVTAPALGIAFVPAERDREGLIPEFTVAENLTLGALPELRERGGFLRPRRESAQARRWLAEIGIDEATADRPVTSLSGGNKQRVLMARCLYTNPTLLVLAEPTAGVDVGARQALYDLLRERAEKGLSILLCSSDTQDLVGVCDRVLVMTNGRIADQMTGRDINAERIVSVMERVR